LGFKQDLTLNVFRVFSLAFRRSKLGSEIKVFKSSNSSSLLAPQVSTMIKDALLMVGLNFVMQNIIRTSGLYKTTLNLVIRLTALA